ncbi:MAG: DUF5305 family protein [Eubacteriales bacterium]
MVVAKSTKTILVILVWVLAVVAFAFTMLQILNPTEHTVEKTIYESDITSAIDYNVRLTNTPVYNKPMDAEPAKYYIVPFTDYISLDCSYSLESAYEADIQANSYATVFLISYIDEGNDEVILWKKEYTLSDTEANQTTGTSISGEKGLKLRLEEYDTLIDQIFDTYGFKSNYYLTIMYTTEFTVSYNGHQEKKTLQPKLRINLEDLLFEVQEDSLSKGKIQMSQQETVADEINWEMVIVGGAIFLLLAVFAMLLPTKILSTASLSEQEKILKQINIKYGDRIVNTFDMPSMQTKAAKVEDITDIIKIADETGQPVFCTKSDGETHYYVTINDVIYYITVNGK